MEVKDLRSEDFYSGEPVITGSPPNFSNPNVVTPISINGGVDEAANMASFGAYAYDPAMRSMMNPGGYGYNIGYGGNPYFMNPPQQQYGGIVYQPPQYGIGAPPSPYGNVQPTYNIYKPGGPNPAFQMGMMPQYQQQQMQNTRAYTRVLKKNDGFTNVLMLSSIIVFVAVIIFVTIYFAF